MEEIQTVKHYPNEDSIHGILLESAKHLSVAHLQQFQSLFLMCKQSHRLKKQICSFLPEE